MKKTIALCLGIVIAVVVLWQLMVVSAVARVSAATNLANTPDDSRNPTLAVAANSVRHVVWEETVSTSPTTTLTYLVHRTWNGVSWSPAVTVSTGTRPALAIGGSTAHLVWTDEFSGTLQVFYSQWNGANWSVPKLIAPGLSGNSSAPTVAVGNDNIVRAAWGQFLNGYKLYYAESAAGGTGAWSAVPVPNAAGNAPSMLVDASNTTHLAWQESVAGFRDILYTAFNGSAWSTPENVSQTASADSLSPSLVLSSGNRPLVAWSETVGAQSDVESSIRGTVSWSVVANISNSAAASSRPQLVRTVADLVVVWNEATTPSVLSYAFGNGGSWTAPQSLVAGGGDWSGGVVASGGDATIHFAYDGGPTANGDVFYDAFNLRHTSLPLIIR